MQIVDNRGLLFRVRDPNRITSVIPTSRQVGANEVLVKWGVDEAQVLRNMNLKNIQSPIMGRYEWPGKYRPFDHQKTTAAFLTMHRRAFCFNEQGTGKTASAIWAADFLLREKKIRRVLVICPLSIMDSAWRADLFTFAMHRTVDIAHGNKDKRRDIIRGDAEFVIINYDGIEIVEEQIKMADFDLIIVDEGTHYKNPQSRRWKCLRNIIKPETWLWLMTGTPAAQSPVDAFGLAKLINPMGVPRFLSEFREMVMTKVTKFKWAPRANAPLIVYNALQPAIRYTKEQCLDLPELTYVKREVELTSQQKQYYKSIRDRMVTMAAGEQITAMNAAILMNKLLQIASGAVYTDTKEVVEFDIKNRYKVLREVIDESSHKVLIFVPFKHAIAMLSEQLTKDGITNGVIAGDVNVRQRTELFHQFQTTENPRVLIIQPQAAAHGVTLTAANTVVWWGPVPSLETYAQANARVHRSGQKNRCTVVQLQGSVVEKKIYKMLDERIDVHSKIVEFYNEMLET
jgi:SNF2 family DNA or RNA helicase